MEIIVTISLILGALLTGAISPGPSFVLIAKLSMGNSRKDGVAASFGMGVGGTFFSLLALLGLHTVLTTVPALYIFLKVLGGLYLLYLGFLIWRGAKEPLTLNNNSLNNQNTIKRSFLIGLITQISNPKTAIVYGSIFAALLPANFPNTLYYILPPLVFLVELSWYLTVSLILSSSSPRKAYLRSKSILDRIAGGVMAGLGVKLVSNASE